MDAEGQIVDDRVQVVPVAQRQAFQFNAAFARPPGGHGGGLVVPFVLVVMDEKTHVKIRNQKHEHPTNQNPAGEAVEGPTHNVRTTVSSVCVRVLHQFD